MQPRLLLAAGVALATLASAAAPAHASVGIDGELIIDFNDWNGAGFAPQPALGQLDSNDWYFTGLSDGDVGDGTTRTTGDFARGIAAGAVTSSGLYAFEVTPGNHAFGIQPSADDATPGALQLSLINLSGRPVAAIEISYTLWVWNDETRSTKVDVALWKYPTSVPIPSLSMTTDAAPDAEPHWVAIQKTQLVNPYAIDGNQYFSLIWTTNDGPGSGGRDQIAIDDIVIRIPVCGDGVRELGETCEQTNNQGGDGCNVACRVEFGYTCNDAIPSVCTTTCGDGKRAPSEGCDDGDLDAADGCSPTCTVEPTWACTGSNPSVCSDLNECATNLDNCSNDATCTNVVGGFTCACKNGYSGNGVTCADVNECTAETDNCDANATCSNTTGSFTCACKPGWSGSGVTCNDVDECAANTDTCAPIATCGNTTGGFTCACPAGTTGDGYTCTDVNECAAGTLTCGGAHEICLNTSGGAECQCDYGWWRVGDSCVDIDECTTGECNNYQTCTNSPGGYTCGCNAGYELSDDSCYDIDECARGLADCDDGEDCYNAQGTFWCSAHVAVCGNYQVEEGETCDDGNRNSWDGCNSNCHVEGCGNGDIDIAESCDDGNLIDHDGCSSTCTFDSFCGNGILNEGESCDDGNTSILDGCSYCAVEYDYTCSGSPSRCTPRPEWVDESNEGCSTTSSSGAGAAFLVLAAFLMTRRRRRA